MGTLPALAAEDGRLPELQTTVHPRDHHQLISKPHPPFVLNSLEAREMACGTVERANAIRFKPCCFISLSSCIPLSSLTVLKSVGIFPVVLVSTYTTVGQPDLAWW